MEEKIKEYFNMVYGEIEPPKELKEKILHPEDKKFLIFAFTATALFIAIGLSIFIEIVPILEPIILEISLP